MDRSDHLLFFRKRGPVQSASGTLFFERDWSAGWANFLLQEVGPFTEQPIEGFDSEKLKDFRFVYLPSALAGGIDPRHAAPFRTYVENGGTLVLEGEAVDRLHFSGVQWASRGRHFKKITRVQEGICPRPFAAHLAQMPFLTRGWERSAPSGEAEVLLEMDGTPVFFRKFLGQGTIFTLGFDFGLLLTGLQQGIPVNGERRLQKLFGTQNRVIEPEDLVLHASLLNNALPWADLFERFLYQVFTSRSPVPRWWYFPAPYSGAVVSSHDEEALGMDPQLETLCQTEESLGVTSTVFVISGPGLHERWLGDGNLKRFANKGIEIGLHWNRFEKPRLKWRRFKWGMHEEPLKNQVHLLEAEAGGPVRTNRNHYLALGRDYGEHFETLAGHGLYFDSTYGPNQGGRGYLFGTGYPFYGLNWQGTSSGVLELPFVTQETWGGADLKFLEQLITESDENFHQCLVTNFHPHYTVLKEKGRAMWLGALRFAQERGQWMPTLGEFFEFFQRRSRGRLESRYSGGELRISLDSKMKQGALSFPGRLSDGKCLIRIEMEGEAAKPRVLKNCWSEEWVLPVPNGTHEVRIFYEG